MGSSLECNFLGGTVPKTNELAFCVIKSHIELGKALRKPHMNVPDFSRIPGDTSDVITLKDQFCIRDVRVDILHHRIHHYYEQVCT